MTGPPDDLARLPVRRIAAGLVLLALLEPVLLTPHAALGAGVPGHATAVITAGMVLPLLLVRSAPLTALLLVSVLLPLRSALDWSASFGVTASLLLLVTAFLAPAAIADRRRLWALPVIGVLHTALLALDGPLWFPAVMLTASRFAVAVALGLALRAALQTLASQRAQRAALERALAAGPAEVVVAEQLRVWCDVQPRLETIVRELPERVRGLRRAAAGGAAAAGELQAVRAAAVAAIEHMRATVHALHLPPEPAAPAAAPGPMPRVRQGRSLHAALLFAMAVLIASGCVEQAVLDIPGPALLGYLAALGLPLTLLPIARRPWPGSLPFAAAILAGTWVEAIGGETSAQNWVAMLGCVLCGLRATGARSVLAFGAVAGSTALAAILEPLPYPLGAHLGSALALAGAWGVGVLLRDTARAARRISVEADGLAAALAELERVTIVRERARLAGELHDLVGHALTAVTVQAGAALARMRHEPDQAQRSLVTLEQAVGLAVRELDQLGRVLRGAAAAAATDARAAIDAAIRRGRRGGQRIDARLAGDLDALAPEQREAVARIVGEALTNAAKHAAGGAVVLRLRVGEDAADLTVDNAAGTPSGIGGGGRGIGLMRARAERCGGRLEAGPRAGGGWRVRAALPLRAQPSSSSSEPGRTSPVS